MRLTPDIVQRSSSHLNPLKERELELRGLQIPLIENLASHQGTYDTLNLTDNSIISLGNIPLSPRIRTIHLGNNNVASIAHNFAQSVPYLENLILTSNTLPSLSSLLPLAQSKNLVSLSLVGNPVQKEKYYREWVIWKIGSSTRLRVLDFQRIKDAERSAARELFLDPETSLPNKLALSLTTDAANEEAIARAVQSGGKGGVVNGDGEGSKGRLLTAEDKKKIRQAILDAGSVEEIKRLERMLNDGRIPEGGSGVEGVAESGEEEAAGPASSEEAVEVGAEPEVQQDHEME